MFLRQQLVLYAVLSEQFAISFKVGKLGKLGRLGKRKTKWDLAHIYFADRFFQ